MQRSFLISTAISFFSFYLLDILELIWVQLYKNELFYIFAYGFDIIFPSHYKCMHSEGMNVKWGCGTNESLCFMAVTECSGTGMCSMLCEFIIMAW